MSTLRVVLAIAGLMLINAHSRAATGSISQFYSFKAESPPAAVAYGAPKYVNRTFYQFSALWYSDGCAARLMSTWVSGPYHGTSEFAGSVAVAGILVLNPRRYVAGNDGTFDSWAYTSGLYNGSLTLIDSAGMTILELYTRSCAAPN